MQAFIKLLFTAFAQSITGFLYVLTVLIAYVNVKSHSGLEEEWLGITRDSLRNRVMEAMLLGMLAGLAVSLLVVGMGIVLDAGTLMFIWPLTLLFMLIGKGHMCFAYAGSIAALSSLVFGWPRADISAIIALVGVLHLTESLLIIINGKNLAVPVVIERKQGSPAGAFVTEKTWPIPLVMLIVPLIDQQAASGGIIMPEWWPVFGTTLGTETMTLLPFAFVIKYTDIAVTETSKQRSLGAGFALLAYSLVVITLAFLSDMFYPVKYAAIAIVPLIYLAISILDINRRKGEKPTYGAPWRGLRVIGIYPDMPAFNMGIREGDILLGINGRAINSEEMLNEALRENPSYIWVDIERGGENITLEHKDFQNDIEDLGLMFVPRRTGRYFKNVLAERKAFSFKKYI